MYLSASVQDAFSAKEPGCIIHIFPVAACLAPPTFVVDRKLTELLRQHRYATGVLLRGEEPPSIKRTDGSLLCRVAPVLPPLIFLHHPSRIPITSNRPPIHAQSEIDVPGLGIPKGFFVNEVVAVLKRMITIAVTFTSVGMTTRAAIEAEPEATQALDQIAPTLLLNASTTRPTRLRLLVKPLSSQLIHYIVSVRLVGESFSRLKGPSQDSKHIFSTNARAAEGAWRCRFAGRLLFLEPTGEAGLVRVVLAAAAGQGDDCALLRPFQADVASSGAGCGRDLFHGCSG